jgi:cyclopropane fatty-acyl-phospholipid synthase-like methyltransferase
METESGAEYISPTHVRHIMRYVKASQWLEKIPIALDAACGTGYGTRILAGRCYQIIGVDNNEDALKEAWKEPLPNHCTFMQADLLTANFRGMDAIVSIETIEHFNQYNGKQVIKNFHKWLSLNGKLIISTPYCDKSGPSPITPQHLWEYSLTDFEQLLTQSGFSIENIRIERHEGQAGRLGYCMVHCVAR